MLRYQLLHCTMCCVMLCCSVLCCVTLCYAVLCCVVLMYIVLYSVTGLLFVSASVWFGVFGCAQAMQVVVQWILSS